MSIYFPSGSYEIDDAIILYREVNIRGDLATRFKPTSGFKSSYVFEITPGPIEKFSIDKIEIDFGNSKQGVGGIHFKAQLANGGSSAGAANGTIKGIRMRSLTGHGIYLEGGTGTAGLEANQYLHFEDIFIERKPGDNNCLRITGASYNNVFINCQFQIHFQTKQEISDTSANIFISTTKAIPQAQTDQTAFINCATGGVPTKGVFFGVKIEKAQNITFENCWFEDTEIGVSITDSRSINIQNCYFANAAGLGSLGGDTFSATSHKGACITVENSFVTVERNNSNVSEINSTTIPYLRSELFINGLGENNIINARNNSFQHVLLSETYGIVQNAYIANIPTYHTSSPALKQGIEIDGKKIVLIRKTSGFTNEIFRINSTISTGETILIRAEDSDLKIWAWSVSGESNSRNIYLGGPAFITLTKGKTALFIKIDGYNEEEKCSYQLVSIN